MMITTETTNDQTAGSNIHDSESNILDEKVEAYKKEAISQIRFSVVIKPAFISFIALIFSFFLDLANVPILGNISAKMAKSLFPTWQANTEALVPYSFWWIPVIIYILFFALSLSAFIKLKKEVIRRSSSETVDKIISSYTTITDSIAMSLPLIGAAILLISIKLGEEVFLGLSVPFEVKALIVLAIGKLFEPVLDQLGLEFQNVVDNVKNMKDRYYSQLQIRNSKSIVKQLSLQSGSQHAMPEMSSRDLEQYKLIMNQTSQLSETILKNFNSVYEVLNKINGMQGLTADKIEQLKIMADSISKATSNLNDERTVTGLKYLESIVKK
jgi:methyl-accepting chemotaxis protein